MPEQSMLRLIKRWKRYESCKKWRDIPKGTRGVFVLYKKESQDRYCVTYIGVAGLGPTGGGGARSRLKSHQYKKKSWTHFSLFEVHDNITRDEIAELEALLLGIFRDDDRLQLVNKQQGSRKLRRLLKRSDWPVQ